MSNLCITADCVDKKNLMVNHMASGIARILKLTRHSMGNMQSAKVSGKL